MGDEGNNLFLGKTNTFLSGEFIISLIVGMLFLGGIYLNINRKVDANTVSIEANTELLARTTTTLTKIDASIEELLVESRIKTEIAKMQTTDRWSAAMVQEHDDIMFDLLRELHPEITRSMLPNIKAIQGRNLQYLYEGNGD